MTSIKGYPGAKQLTVDMGPKAFLADLYEAAWVERDLKRLFTPVNVVRDPNAPAYEIPRNPLKLSWKNMVAEPSAICVRDEYRAMLGDVVRYAVQGESRPGQRSKQNSHEMDVDSIYDMPLHNDIADLPNTPPASKGAIVIGTPGIGKTLFLYYALAFCLHARRPVILQDVPGTLYVMDGDGVFEVPFPTSTLDFVDYISPGTWFFVDTGPNLSAPPPACFTWRTYSKGFILQTASPHNKHIEWTDKVAKVLPFWMSPWTLGELIAARDCQSWRRAVRPSEKDLATFVELYGGCPRDAYLFSTEQAAFENKLHSGKLHTLTTHQMKLLTDLACSHRLGDETSHRLLMMYPGPYDRTVFNVQIPTTHLFELVLEALQKDNNNSPAILYHLFIRNSRLRVNAKYFLQRAISAAFTKGGQWPVTAMQSISVENTVHWHLDKNIFPLYLRLGYRGNIVEISSSSVDASTEQFVGQKSHVLDVSEDPNLVLEDGLYSPHSWDVESFNPFVYDAKTKTATMIQITTWKSQKIRGSELDWLRSHGSAIIDLVVVTPPLQEEDFHSRLLVSTLREDVLDNVEIYVPPRHAIAMRNVYHLSIEEVEV